MLNQTILWETPPAELELDEAEVHLWLHWLDQPEERIRELAAALAPEEYARAERFRFEIDRKRFLAGREMLRVLLGRYLQLDPSQVALCQGLHGKPALASRAGDSLQFNLSHSGPLALYALARQRPVGVDLEETRPVADLGALARHVLSDREKVAWQAIDPSGRLEAFYHCWVRKEAYIKATGAGVALALDQFAVSLSPGQPACLLHVMGQPGEPARWSMLGLVPASGYVAALVVEGHGWRLRCWR